MGLEKERIRLETELSEAVRGRAQHMHSMETPSLSQTAVQRPRGSTWASAGNTIDSRDLEAGGAIADYDEAEGRNKGSAAMSALVARSLNHIWALLAKHAPSALQVLGERPPRLGHLGQGVLIYMVVLHVLLLTRII